MLSLLSMYCSSMKYLLKLNILYNDTTYIYINHILIQSNRCQIHNSVELSKLFSKLTVKYVVLLLKAVNRHHITEFFHQFLLL